MRNKDTAACGCGAVQTASVFRAVDTCAPCSYNGTDWNHWDRNARQGCSGCGHACEGCHTACEAANHWGGDTGSAARCPRCGNTPCTCEAENSCNTAWNGCNNTCAGNTARCPRCGNSPCTCNAENSCNAAWNGCNNTCAGTAARCPRCGNSPCTCNAAAYGIGPAMVYETGHSLEVHAAEEAIRKGTLFSELYMPMMGECADNCGAQLCDGQAEAFAAWELRLYLNTHPHDRHALELFRQYARCADQPNYAGAFAFDDGCPDRWSWTDAPWPWEHNAACENNCGCN